MAGTGTDYLDLLRWHHLLEWVAKLQAAGSFVRNVGHTRCRNISEEIDECLAYLAWILGNVNEINSKTGRISAALLKVGRAGPAADGPRSGYGPDAAQDGAAHRR